MTHINMICVPAIVCRVVHLFVKANVLRPPARQLLLSSLPEAIMAKPPCPRDGALLRITIMVAASTKEERNRYLDRST
jgi:hypothetical protein